MVTIDGCEHVARRKMMSRLMVLGVGDILKCDKGLGIYAVRDLYREGWSNKVDFVDEAQINGGLSLQGYGSLLVLGGFDIGREPGTMFRFTLDDLLLQREMFSSVCFWEALTMAELCGQSIRVSLLGVVPQQIDWDVSLSSAVNDVYPAYLDSVRHEMEAILHDMDRGDTPVEH
jgi:hydrogenase maturation protease